jgi:hypothetical protein
LFPGTTIFRCVVLSFFTRDGYACPRYKVVVGHSEMEETVVRRAVGLGLQFAGGILGVLGVNYMQRDLPIAIVLWSVGVTVLGVGFGLTPKKKKKADEPLPK